MKKILQTLATIVLTLVVSYFIFSDKGKVTTNYMGYKNDVFYKGSNKHAHDLLNRAVSFESHIAWATGNHTSSPVPCGAVGPEKYTDQLKGIIQNTDIAKVCHQAVNDGINVMLVIGDGMGVNHMSLPIYMNIAEKNDDKTYFEKIMKEGSCGLSLTNPAEGIVTGSAAAATALASGTKTFTQALGIDTCGNDLKSTLELAEEKGYVTGLITDTGITDGTPAAFYANSVNRDFENNIATQLIEKNEIEVIFGGGGKRFIPKGKHLKDYYNYKNCSNVEIVKSARDDDKNLFQQFDEKGYEIICTRDELLSLDKNCNRVVGFFAAGGLNAAIDRDDEITSQPSLVQMADKGLEILASKAPKYFVMVEAGRIDWEAHDNDAGAVYKAMEEMNLVLGKCYDYYQKDKDNTLLIFTADHETGGFNISYTKLPKGEYYTKQFKNGEIWKNRTDPLYFNKFLLLKDQKSPVYKTFQKATTVDYLYKKINENMGYKITKEDAEVLHNIINDYHKGK